MTEETLTRVLENYHTLDKITSEKAKELSVLLKKNGQRTRKKKLSSNEQRTGKTLLTRFTKKKRQFHIKEKSTDFSNIEQIHDACVTLQEYEQKLTQMLKQIHKTIDIKPQIWTAEEIQNYLLNERTEITITIDKYEDTQSIQKKIFQYIQKKIGKTHGIKEEDIHNALTNLNIQRPNIFTYGENIISYGEEPNKKHLTVKIDDKEIAENFMKANEGDEKFDQELFTIRTLIQQINNKHNLRLNNENMYTLICGIHNSEINQLFQNTSTDDIEITKNEKAQLDNGKQGTRIIIKNKNQERAISFFLSSGTIYNTKYLKTEKK